MRTREVLLGVGIGLGVSLVYPYILGVVENMLSPAMEFDTVVQDEAQVALKGPRRLRKAETVLRKRIGRIVIVVEKSVDSLNHMSILRTAEALGIQHVWFVEADRMKDKKDLGDFKANTTIARTSTQWLSVRQFPNSSACIAAIQAQGREIWATDLSQHATAVHRSTLDNAIPECGIALVVGKESTGVSEEFLEAACRRIYLPLYGWGDSLNLSIATALVLHTILLGNPSVYGTLGQEDEQGLRATWYEQLGKTESQRNEYRNWVDKKATPYGDMRRTDTHRSDGWVQKKVIKKEEAARESKAAAQES